MHPGSFSSSLIRSVVTSWITQQVSVGLHLFSFNVAAKFVLSAYLESPIDSEGKTRLHKQEEEAELQQIYSSQATYRKYLKYFSF